MGMNYPARLERQLISGTCLADTKRRALAQMTTEFNRYFQCIEANSHWEFQVGQVTWPDPGIPDIKWKIVRRWSTPPDPAQLAKARAAALNNPRFFRTCKRCEELNNAGHMHDKEICQSCATRYLGVVY